MAGRTFVCEVVKSAPPSHQGRQIVRQKNKLFVGGLSADTKEEDLRSHFMQFGQVGAYRRTDSVQMCVCEHVHTRVCLCMHVYVFVCSMWHI